MLDLGKYSFAVLGSWAVALGLVGLLILISWWRSVQVRRELAEVEARLSGHDAG